MILWVFYNNIVKTKVHENNENATSKNILTHCWSMVTTTRYFEGAAAHVKMHSGAKQKLKCLNSNKEDLYYSWKSQENLSSYFGLIDGRMNRFDKEQPLKNCCDSTFGVLWANVKGQFISKCPFGVFKLTNKPTKFL